MVMNRSTFVQVTEFELPRARLPIKSFIHDLRADNPRYFILQTLPPVDTRSLLLKKLDLDSSFITLYSIVLGDSPEVSIGYCMDVKRGTVNNLGLALIIAKSSVIKEPRVNLSLTQTINLGDFLKIFRLGDSAIYIGASNKDAISFFY